MSRIIPNISVAMKYVSAVEVDPIASNQHELGGVNAFKHVLGTEKLEGFPSQWLLLDDEGAHTTENHTLSWYDSRENTPSRSAEFRLYYSGETALEAGDLFAILKTSNGELFGLGAREGTSWMRQLIKIFSVEPGDHGAVAAFDAFSSVDHYEQIISDLFELLGIGELTGLGPDFDLAEQAIRKFGHKFPTSALFSAFAREIASVDHSDPDGVLLEWIKTEKTMFLGIEKIQVEARLETGFESVDDFIQYSLSVHNRRKARAGKSLQNHLGALFDHSRIRFVEDTLTENGNKPDFLLPGREEYFDPGFNPEHLTMLGAKTTCKDRWRQVLVEAKRVPSKHLCTLEPGISRSQLSQMKSESVTLVVPEKISADYEIADRAFVLNLSEFIALATDRQSKAEMQTIDPD